MPINKSGHLFITELGRCLSRLTGDTREPAIFISAFCITIQRFNAGSALKITLDARVDELNRALNKLSLISRQDALLILRSSLGAPKLIYNLRSAPCANHPSLTEYD